MNIQIIDRPQQAKPLQMSRDELTKLIDLKYQRRTFIADDIKEFVSNLPPEKAFALSRLLPKEILEKVLNMRGAEAFGNNIIEYYNKFAVDGKLPDDIVKTVEELFLVTHSAELVKVISG